MAMRALLCAGILCAAVAAGHAAVIGKATVTAEQAPVMQGKDTVLTAKKGDVFDVNEIAGDWYGVLPSRGWIHKANVRYEASLPRGTANPRETPAAAQPAPAAPTAAAPAEVALDLGSGVTMKMVLIRPGKFMMGEGTVPPFGPQHEVILSNPFYMGVTEVTQAQYEAVMGTNPSRFKGATNPVETVSWNDATEFCKKLSEKTRQAVHLPTEAEWEYACRAGTQTAYSFGDAPSALGDYAWWGKNGGMTTHPVGQKKPNAWGLYDMHGNVWEWCADWYADYPKGPVTDPAGPATGGARVFRGGSWLFVVTDYFRCAYRYFNVPTLRFSNFGFRCARTLP